MICQKLLHKAKRELEVEEKSRRRESRHFTLHYEGDRTGPEMQQALLATLENEFQELGRQFNYQPSENIIVTLTHKRSSLTSAKPRPGQGH
jgi:hypothetical protein